MNIPYVKHHDKNGSIINPIKGSYLHKFPNRQQRRKDVRKERFHGESKNHHLTVMRNGKYLRIRDLIAHKKTGERKTIEHYILQ